MDTLSLRLFLRVAETGNLTKSAKDLSLSPASASARLAKLEEIAGFRLFNRTTRSISLTTDGTAFLPYAEQSIDLLDSGISHIKGNHESVTGLLRFAMPASFGRMYVIPLMGEFTQRYPDVTLDLRLSDRVIDPVEGAFDLIIRNTHLEDSNLIARKLAYDKRVLVASPDYLAKHGTPQTPNDLLQHQCVSFSNNHKWRFNNGEVVHVPKSISINDGVAMRKLLENGMGIGIKPIWNAYNSLQSGELVEVLMDYPLLTDTDVWVLYQSNCMLAPKVRVMIDFLIEKFKPVPPWGK